MDGLKQFYEANHTSVKIQAPLRKQSNGDREFAVKDSNGYILVFSELTE